MKLNTCAQILASEMQFVAENIRIYVIWHRLLLSTSLKQYRREIGCYKMQTVFEEGMQVHA